MGRQFNSGSAHLAIFLIPILKTWFHLLALRAGGHMDLKSIALREFFYTSISIAGGCIALAIA
jgi:hypothetical protein